VILSICRIVEFLTSLDVLESVGSWFEVNCCCLGIERESERGKRKRRANLVSFQYSRFKDDLTSTSNRDWGKRGIDSPEVERPVSSSSSKLWVSWLQHRVEPPQRVPLALIEVI